ncbi:hypothetical protein CN221_11055 [Sinorhizobium meliloti]|uniref:LMBR1 domain-containing protein n=1 Tax=Rhizobium meliloti TaxID=382 RepID=UPI000FE070FF|nr:LMBR1 domain-containing protein [Sinorhizobium meliloti]RVG96684.1 hypothetical protein CN221_11055 [Sinorhizobium meliloti]RVH69393.1 hypothetical protein CN209_02775 [Sinorhizobium meliloti]
MNTMDTADLRSRVVSLEHKHASTEQRLTSMEQRFVQADIADARKEEQWKNLLEKFVGLDKKLDKINGYLVTIVLAIVLAVLGAFMTFVTRGGLNIPS